MPTHPIGFGLDIYESFAGSQYTSLAFTDALVAAGIAGSIGSVGDALDNALMESAIIWSRENGVVDVADEAV